MDLSLLLSTNVVKKLLSVRFFVFASELNLIGSLLNLYKVL